MTSLQVEPTPSLQRSGQCLGGAVTLTATLAKPAIHACHCTQCQRWTGGGPLPVVEVDALEVETTADPLVFRASDHGEQASCSVCGSPLWWRMQGRPVRSVAVGLLDDQSGLSVTEEIFVDFRACWLDAHDGASQSTEAEEFAKLDAFLANDRS